MGCERKRGKLARPQRAAARRAPERFARDRRRDRGARRACGTSSRSTPTRSCRATRRASSSATMAHPLNRAALRRPRTRRRVTDGLRHPAAARRRQPARREPLALRAAVRRRAGHRSVHARGLRRLPGPVRRGLVHRQGHLRRRRVRAARSAGRLPENRILSHDLLEGCYARAGLVSDVQLLRGVSRRATAPTCSRRHRWIRGDWQIAGWLLPRVPGASGGAGSAIRSRRCRAGRSSTTCAAASCRRRCTLLLLARLERAAPSRGSGRWRVVGDPAAAGADRALARPAAQARRAAPARSTSRRVAASRGAPCSRRRCSRSRCLPYEAVVSARRDRAHRCGACWSRAAACCEWNARRATSAAQPARATASRHLRGDVDRARRSRSRSRRWPRVARPAALPARRAGPAAVAAVARCIAWWLSRPLARPRAAAQRGADARSCARLARRTWAFFETFVGAGRPLAAARQLPGASRPRSSRTAPRRPTSACRCSRTWRRTTSATSRPAQLVERTDATLDTMEHAGAPPRPLLQLVRHADAGAAARRATSRRSTAATSPATC